LIIAIKIAWVGGLVGGLERVVDFTAGAGVEQRLVTAVNRGKFVKQMKYIIP
jgi:hypothetical protein